MCRFSIIFFNFHWTLVFFKLFSRSIVIKKFEFELTFMYRAGTSSSPQTKISRMHAYLLLPTAKPNFFTFQKTMFFEVVEFCLFCFFALHTLWYTLTQIYTSWPKIIEIYMYIYYNFLYLTRYSFHSKSLYDIQGATSLYDIIIF